MFATPPKYIASRHAVQRMLERHRPELTHQQAESYLLQLAASGHTRPTGRHWLRRIHHPRPGTTYIVSASDPDCALVMRGPMICTVLVRSMAGHGGLRHGEKLVGLERYRRWRQQELTAEVLAERFDDQAAAA